MHRALAIAAIGMGIGIGVGGCGAGAPTARATTLTSLRDAMQWVRGGHAAQPRALDELPSVEALPGASRAELTRQIGAPRSCGYPIEAPCARPGEVLWTFYRGHGADESAGPVLVVDFDDAGTITQAHWRRGDVEAADAPIAPATSGGEAIAATEIAPADQLAPDQAPVEETAPGETAPAEPEVAPEEPAVEPAPAVDAPAPETASVEASPIASAD